MSHLKTVTVDVDVHVDLEDIATDDLIEELEDRPDATSRIPQAMLDMGRMYSLRLCGQKDHADREILESVWKFIDEGNWV